MDYSGGIEGLRQKTRSAMVQEFVPSSGWTEDADGHYLLVDLPEAKDAFCLDYWDKYAAKNLDFKKEEVKLQVDNSGHITVSGERKVRDGKFSYFEKTHDLPENADINRITGKFDGEILYVTVPKKEVEKGEEPQNEIVNAEDIARKTECDKFDKENNSSKNDEEEHENEQESRTDSSKKKEESKKYGCQEHPHQEDTEKSEPDTAYMLKSLIGKLSKNKGIVITAVVAFSVGVLVSRKIG